MAKNIQMFIKQEDGYEELTMNYLPLSGGTMTGTIKCGAGISGGNNDFQIISPYLGEDSGMGHTINASSNGFVTIGAQDKKEEKMYTRASFGNLTMQLSGIKNGVQYYVNVKGVADPNNNYDAVNFKSTLKAGGIGGTDEFSKYMTGNAVGTIMSRSYGASGATDVQVGQWFAYRVQGGCWIKLDMTVSTNYDSNVYLNQFPLPFYSKASTALYTNIYNFQTGELISDRYFGLAGYGGIRDYGLNVGVYFCFVPSYIPF